METSWFFSWIVVPFLIVITRVLDVSFGTLRIIYLAQRRKIIVPILGFVEVLIWLIVISQVMQNLTNPVYYIAYALGFVIGNYIGISLEEMLAIGNLMVRVVTRIDDTRLITTLRNHNYKVTIVDAEGLMGPVKILFTNHPLKRQRRSPLKKCRKRRKTAYHGMVSARNSAITAGPSSAAVRGSRDAYLYLL